MIICIDGQYFNPLQIKHLYQVDSDVIVCFDSTGEGLLRFVNWKIYDFAAHVNQLIKEF